MVLKKKIQSIVIESFYYKCYNNVKIIGGIENECRIYFPTFSFVLLELL